MISNTVPILLLMVNRFLLEFSDDTGWTTKNNLYVNLFYKGNDIFILLFMVTKIFTIIKLNGIFFKLNQEQLKPSDIFFSVKIVY